jgi:hypothetical protein
MHFLSRTNRRASHHYIKKRRSNTRKTSPAGLNTPRSTHAPKNRSKKEKENEHLNVICTEADNKCRETLALRIPFFQ